MNLLFKLLSRRNWNISFPRNHFILPAKAIHAWSYPRLRTKAFSKPFFVFNVNKLFVNTRANTAPRRFRRKKEWEKLSVQRGCFAHSWMKTEETLCAIIKTDKSVFACQTSMELYFRITLLWFSLFGITEDVRRLLFRREEKLSSSETRINAKRWTTTT